MSAAEGSKIASLKECIFVPCEVEKSLALSLFTLYYRSNMKKLFILSSSLPVAQCMLDVMTAVLL